MDEQRIRMNAALADLARGRPIIVLDDFDRENEGDLVAPAECADAELINFMAGQARGLVCVAMSGDDLDRLDVPMMAPHGRTRGPHDSPFTVSVEAAEGVTTGISAADRARTVRVLADARSGPSDIVMPGHVFPLRAHPGGLTARRGHTEAGVELMRRAGMRPAAVICEIMNEDGTMARRPDLERFAARHDLRLISIRDICATDSRDERAPDAERVDPDSDVVRIESAMLPTRYGPFRVTAYRGQRGDEHLLLEFGDPASGTEDAAAPLVRIHSECLTGDALGSLRCDCGDQLAAAMQRIAQHGSGAVVYLRQEGRGIGLINKIKAYALQDEGMDTVEANRCLGFEPDSRDYRAAASVLLERGISAVRLMTNNPGKVQGLRKNGVQVRERIPLQTGTRPENQRYLKTKAAKLAHLLETD
ncbi:MAG: GTP cyclohydrolase II [Rhodothermales bacterium]|nr:GTP cyclohydrolase II [Rhodothermales bacterium]